MVYLDSIKDRQGNEIQNKMTKVLLEDLELCADF